MIQNRRGAAAIALAVLMVTAGCGFLSGSTTSFSADKATVSDSAASESGYEEVKIEAQNVSREFSAAGQSREVNVTNWLAQYDRQVDLGPLGERRAGVFAAFSTPAVEILGQTFNPIDDMSDRDIIERFQENYQSVNVGQQVDSADIETLNKSAEVNKYEGTAEIGGSEVDVYIHLSKFRHGDDFIVALAIYPQDLDGEEERAMTMYRGLEHEK